MRLAVIYRSAAQTDIAETCNWYEERQPGLGAVFLTELAKAEVLFGENPQLYERIRGEIRRAPMHKFPYSIYYIPRSDFISVLAVMRHSRHPKAWKNRK